MVETGYLQEPKRLATLWCDQAKSSHHEVDPIGRLMIAADINPSPPNLKEKKAWGSTLKGKGTER